MARGEVDEGMLAVGGLMNPALGNPGRPCWVVLALFFSLSFSLSFSFFFKKKKDTPFFWVVIALEIRFSDFVKIK